jgi:NitT/TauT family transport system substrate-binding protein
MKLTRRNALILSSASIASLALVNRAHAQAKKSFKVAWSIYVGWMPWGYANDTGIVKKWADKYGITIEVTQFNDYVESINQYTAGAFDALTVTNMDALSVPSAGGVDTTAVIMGDFSNGNDAVILKGKDSLADIKGQKVNLVEFSVSHYLLARALESVGLTERDVTVVNTSDADMVAAWKAEDVTAVVSWNPLVGEILTNADAKKVYDSSQVPGEIMDLLVANTATIAANPDFGKALAGIWYDTMSAIAAGDAGATAAKEAMAKASGTDLPGFEAQLAATKLFSKPADALAFTTGKDIGPMMDKVRSFLFDKGLLGQGAASKDVIGIALADGTTLGDANNIKFRFDAQYMKMAADGAL